MWECPCVTCIGLICFLGFFFFGVRAVFGMDDCRLFPHCMLAVMPLIGGLTGVVVTLACPGYRAGAPLCSVVVTVLSGAESSP